MGLIEYSSKLFIFLLLCGSAASNKDKPCAARPINNASVVCVCNATYCDEVTREPPTSGRFNVYTSSKGGLRFFKTSDDLKPYSPNDQFCSTILDLDLSTKYQSVEGFGGAVSDSAAIIWANITEPALKNYLIESFFGQSGNEYNMIRVPIGSTDFSMRYYSYNEHPENETSLTNFTLAPEDLDYKMPMIKAAMGAATDDIHIVASSWSSPLWMKTKHEVSGVARIRPEYYHAFAQYHYKFLDSYANHGIGIWGLTTVNEPLSGLMSLGKNPRVTWTTKGLGKWISEDLGPMIRNSTFKDVKIMTGDDQRLCIPLWFNMVVIETKKALDYIDGIAVHFYFDDFTPPDLLTEPLKKYPGKFVLYTESSFGAVDPVHVALGSWERAKRVAGNILEDLNYNVVGWIDWNLCLNPQGGPSWINASLDAAIIVYAEEKEFIKQPMYYALGHFSKFLPRGSVRVGTKESTSCKNTVENVSFVTPRGTIITVLQNKHEEEHPVIIRVGDTAASVIMPPESIATVEFLQQ